MPNVCGALIKKDDKTFFQECQFSSIFFNFFFFKYLFLVGVSFLSFLSVFEISKC